MKRIVNKFVYFRGTSLLEITVALAVISILSSMALPSVRNLLNNTAIRSHRQALLQDIRTVRRYAITYRVPAYLCALDAQNQCVSTINWNNGWVGYLDNNVNGRYDTGDERILQQAKIKPGVKIQIFLHARWLNIKFDSRGILRRSGHFRVCIPENQEIQTMKVIRMNTFGRLSLESDRLSCE